MDTSNQVPLERLRQQVRLMSELQDGYNREVAPDWRSAGLPFYRAIWVESAELLDHFGWKWWKKQVPDAEQVRLELVDIWHFGMSDLMVRELFDVDEVTALLDALQRRWADDAPASAEAARSALEDFASRTLTARAFDLTGFVTLMRAFSLSPQALFEGYVAKNVLNRFRLEHGYQDGSYRKHWNGVEDNVHLAEVLAVIDLEREDVLAAIRAALVARYTAAG